jgi:hypothetical protein
MKRPVTRKNRRQKRKTFTFDPAAALACEDGEYITNRERYANSLDKAALIAKLSQLDKKTLVNIYVHADEFREMPEEF